MDETTVRTLWKDLYGDERTVLNGLVDHLKALKRTFDPGRSGTFPTTGLVYCTYADAFGQGLDGVRGQLPRLQSLGVTILWLLPLLESPGRDQGFDISDYRNVAPSLGGNEALARLLAAAHPLGIKVIFDIAVNHTSEQHPWFQAALDPGSPFRDYYHWSTTGKEYAGLPVIFPDFVDSNWTWRPEAGAWNFHRFYPFQPDLDYQNPLVASEMAQILTDWRSFGVDGFRMDAAPLLWKEEGTDCDSLPQTHLILRLFRACLEFLAPGSLLLAEANVNPEPPRDYFGAGDECQAAYQFQLMPRFFQAMMTRDPQPVAETRVPDLPPGCAWFTFLRLHDELTLDLVAPEDRIPMVQAYQKGPETLFRSGQAVSGRLFELFDRDPDRTLLAWSLLFSAPGTPLLYYGDEIAMGNNRAYFEAKAAETGYRDSRFLHRGPWDAGAEARSSQPGTPEGRLRTGLEFMLKVRKDHPALAAAKPALSVSGPVLTSVRRHRDQSLTMVTNLKAGTWDWTLDPTGA